MLEAVVNIISPSDDVLVIVVELVATFVNKPASPLKNLLFPTTTLPVVSKDTFVFVIDIFIAVVEPTAVTWERLPTPLLPLTLSEPQFGTPDIILRTSPF